MCPFMKKINATDRSQLFTTMTHAVVLIPWLSVRVRVLDLQCCSKERRDRIHIERRLKTILRTQKGKTTKV